MTINSIQRQIGFCLLPLLGLIMPTVSFAAESGQMLTLGGIRLEFILFAFTLLGVALFHHYTMFVSLAGLAAVVASKYAFLDDFSFVHHIMGGAGHEGEWRIMLNLFGLLSGFAALPP